jgi:DNA polymerase V
MKARDELNFRFGRDTLGFAGSGLSRPWKLRRDLLSKRYTTYTTDWNESLELTT